VINDGGKFAKVTTGAAVIVIINILEAVIDVPTPNIGDRVALIKIS
jgi:hypothetical protein